MTLWMVLLIAWLVGLAVVVAALVIAEGTGRRRDRANRQERVAQVAADTAAAVYTDPEAFTSAELDRLRQMLADRTAEVEGGGS
ncbi:MAG TPA: hypothetical protein VFW64_12435 [Pseudonocardiaceae bacterium]|nr:hypothetical protein [Pseudonocardiaceae bacterium]